MAPRDTTLLYLVLCLTQKIQTQEGDLPIPVISAMPSPVVPWNGSVKILCRGTPDAFLYHLEKLGNSTNKVMQKSFGFQERARFTIEHVDTNTVGRYQCQYRKGYHWSESSQALELVVTGLYDKPTLSATQGLVVMSGENISLQCGSAQVSFDRLSLAKEEESTLPQHQEEGPQGSFTLGPMNLSFSGTYRCYGWYSGSPYVWSAPSDALELVVIGSMSQDYTMQNLIRMGVAALVLLVLLAILADSWHSHKVSQEVYFQEVPELSSCEQRSQTV